MFCECGCGGLAPISKVNRRSRGQVKGEPVRFIRGHAGNLLTPKVDLGRSGFCECGCGEKTPISTFSNLPLGFVKGQPARYIFGHRQLMPVSEETRQKYKRRNVRRGENHPNWKGGITPERIRAATNTWAREVKRRDKNTCQECGHTQNKRMHAHHIKSWKDAPSSRFDVENGITLCPPCHKTKHLHRRAA